MRVYLAGPINGCTDAEARGWRDAVKAQLAGCYTFTDPMDDDFRGHEEGNAAEIVRRDKARIRHSQIVLANPWKPSVGTPMEVLYAHGDARHVIVIGTHLSPWYVHHASLIVPTVDAAIAHLRAASAVSGEPSEGGRDARRYRFLRQHLGFRSTTDRLEDDPLSYSRQIGLDGSPEALDAWLDEQMQAAALARADTREGGRPTAEEHEAMRCAYEDAEKAALLRAGGDEQC